MKNKTKSIILFLVVTFSLLLITLLIKLFIFPSVKFKLVGDKTTSISYGEKYTEKGVVAVVNGRDYSKKVEIDNNVDLEKLGEYKVVYKLNLLREKLILTRKVNIVDKEPPIITLNNSNSIRLDYGTPYVEAGYTVSDNYDKTEDIKVKISGAGEINPNISGEYIITYEAIDTSGNIAKVIRSITISPYEKIKVIDGITYVDGVLIANKKYSLPRHYNPGVNATAYQKLVELNGAAALEGHNIPLVSGFRSYDSQRSIYNNYVSIYGVELTDTFSARPGTSEHQTGLAFDVGKIDDNYGNTPAGIWLKENAHKYGFIIRYPEGKQHITGYKYEPWHIRYLGVSLATKVYNSGLTLEEYLGIEGK